MKISEFAQKTGVTVKTLLHYDKKGLLSPTHKTEMRYRIYTDKDILRLQQIITLKFIGLSLNEIKNLLDDEGNVKNLIKIQKDALEEKKQDLETAINALKNAEIQMEHKGAIEVDELINIIEAIEIKAKVKEQYKLTDNLKARGDLHSYNTNHTDWTQWCFNQMHFPDNARILEIGCGTGDLWFKNKESILKNWSITLSDHSEAMLQKTKDKLLLTEHNFTYKTLDAQEVPYADNSFDIIIARHMLYLVPDIDKALSEMKRVLVKGGTVYITTNSNQSMKELNELMDAFDSKLALGNNGMCDRFDCENGAAMLKNHFSEIKMSSLDGKIVIDQSEPIVAYKASTIHGRKKLVGEKKANFKSYIDAYLEKNRQITITTKACLYHVKK